MNFYKWVETYNKKEINTDNWKKEYKKYNNNHIHTETNWYLINKQCKEKNKTYNGRTNSWSTNKDKNSSFKLFFEI